MTLGPGLSRTPLPKGFLVSGINSGVRRYRPDLGLIYSEKDCTGAGVFTLNQCKAAPVLHSQALLPGHGLRAIVTNSGQANAATGSLGQINNQKMVDAVAEALGCRHDQVLTASTGVIGQQLDIDKITAAAPELVTRLGDAAESFALAILTTDLVPKSASMSVRLSRGTVCITGICKGSGMIHPNMATMLGYILTDAELEASVAQDLLRESVAQSFNMISVDGDSSTNDCVFLLANGESTVGLATDLDREIFQEALNEISILLAQSIAADGEGASKLVEVKIEGAPDLALARRAARGVTISPLVKTAIHGEDPNWGRVLARLGAEQVPLASLEKMDLFIQGVELFRAGQPVEFDRQLARTKMKSHKVQLLIRLHSGSAIATAWGCDLSKKYVDINTEYS